MFGKVGECISRMGHRAILKAKIHSPELLIGAGIVSVVGGVVLCCKATLKIEGVLDNNLEYKNKIAQAREEMPDQYSEKDAARDAVVLRVQTGAKLAKLYAPGVLSIAVGIGCFFASYGILKKRQVLLVGAYNALVSDFNDYRNRIRNIENGPAIDRAAMIGDACLKGGDDMNLESNARGTRRMDSPYVKCFSGQYSVEWARDGNLNYTFLKQQERWANERLRANGHLFLNEVLDLLGLDRTESGALTGWLYDWDNDNKVSFGFDNPNSIAYISPADVARGDHNEFILDFNVDGVICDKI